MRATAFLALSAVLVGCGGSHDAGSAQAAADAMASAGTGMPMSFEPIKLQARDVERFISVLEDFTRLGVEYDEKVGSDPSLASVTMHGLGANAQAMAILRDHDLDMVKFQQLTYTVMMALAAAEMADHAPDPAAEQAQMAQLKASLPPEQYEAMMKAQQGAAAMTREFANQPAGNVELVARYRDAIEAAGRKNH